jgi:hypothetical protein
MKQSINLHQGRKEGGEERLNAETILRISLGFLGLLVLSSVYQGISHIFVEIEEERLGKELTRVEKESAMKEQILANKQVKEIKEGLEIEAQKIEEQLKTNQKIIATLGQVRKNKNKGFSNFMTALAKGGFPEIWMTEFAIKGEGEYISLQGTTVAPQHVPRLIENLSKETVFQGKSFEIFKMLRSETDVAHITFLLQTLKENTP